MKSYSRVIQQMNAARVALLDHYASTSGQAEEAQEAADTIERAIVVLGGSVDSVPGYDCQAERSPR